MKKGASKLCLTNYKCGAVSIAIMPFPSLAAVQ